MDILDDMGVSKLSAKVNYLKYPWEISIAHVVLYRGKRFFA